MKEIIDILTILQKGYKEKKPENASIIIAEIFSNRHDTLILGTGTGEVCIGREEVTKLIYDDWEGWGDFTIDIDSAKTETYGDTAWFYTDCTVKYSFGVENPDDQNNRYVNFVKEITENQATTPKQKLAFLNWALGLNYHQRKPGKRDYLWPIELSGILIKENSTWKIATLHFAAAKPDFPDERFEEAVGDYQSAYNSTRDKIINHTGNKAGFELIDFLKQSESEMANEMELVSICFDPEQIIAFGMGRFLWVMALGVSKQDIDEGEVFDRSLGKIRSLLNSGLSPEDKLFQTKRSIAYTLKESASGSDFTWPIRLTAVVEKTESGYRFRHKHFSYPFYWIFEGKL